MWFTVTHTLTPSFTEYERRKIKEAAMMEVIKRQIEQITEYWHFANAYRLVTIAMQEQAAMRDTVIETLTRELKEERELNARLRDQMLRMYSYDSSPYMLKLHPCYYVYTQAKQHTETQ